MSDAKVPCGRMQGSHNPIDNETYAQMYCCKAKLCPNCTELLALRRRVEDWRAWVAGIIGFDHVATAKTDSHMRQDVKDEIQRLIDRVGEVDVAGARRVAELEEAQDELMGLCDSMLQYVPTFEQRTEIRKVLGKRAAAAEVAAGEKTKHENT